MIYRVLRIQQGRKQPQPFCVRILISTQERDKGFNVGSGGEQQSKGTETGPGDRELEGSTFRESDQGRSF